MGLECTPQGSTIPRTLVQVGLRHDDNEMVANEHRCFALVLQQIRNQPRVTPQSAPFAVVELCAFAVPVKVDEEASWSEDRGCQEGFMQCLDLQTRKTRLR